MPIIRHQFTTLSAETSGPIKGKTEINSSISFTGLEPDDSMSGSSTKGFSITYEFTTRYNKTEAKVRVFGRVLYLAQENAASEIEEQWGKNKTLPESIVLEVGNYCLLKAQMQAISLAKDVGLQSPVRLPKFEQKQAAGAPSQ